MNIAAVLLLALGGAFVVLVGYVRHHIRKSEATLRSLFEPGHDFIGKSYDYITLRAGPPTSYGSTDRGQDVAQWIAGELLAEAVFESGVCTEVYLRVLQR